MSLPEDLDFSDAEDSEEVCPEGGGHRHWVSCPRGRHGRRGRR